MEGISHTIVSDMMRVEDIEDDEIIAQDMSLSAAGTDQMRLLRQIMPSVTDTGHVSL